MRKVIASEWMTLDGVFDANSMMDWFAPFDSTERQDYIKQNVLTSGAVLVGRVTYEMLASYWPSKKNNEDGIADKLNSMPKHVVSSTLEKADWNPSTIIKENVAGEIAKLKKEPGDPILIFGSATLVHSLMNADLIDEYRILVHPIIMGSGKRFFKDGMPGAKLKLVESKALPSGVLFNRYQPAS
jgi:dihydrofolate reductase